MAALAKHLSIREVFMSHRGLYLGGHTILHADPHGREPIPDHRPKRIKLAESLERSAELAAEMDRRAVQIAAEKAALRKFYVTAQDRSALGMNCSGWLEFKVRLAAEFLLLDSAKITRADVAAKVLNRRGFRTCAGRQWTPRLVKIGQTIVQI